MWRFQAILRFKINHPKIGSFLGVGGTFFGVRGTLLRVGWVGLGLGLGLGLGGLGMGCEDG